MKAVGKRGQLISMGSAVIFERLIQFSIPLILVRIFPVEEFGYFKLFWLLSNTVMLFSPLGLPNSLMFFLPRSDRETRRAFIFQTIAVLLVTGLLGALLVSPLSPFRPATVEGTPVDSYVISLFIIFWVLASLIDTLPSADQNVTWQVRSITLIAILRLFCVAGTAVVTNDLGWVIFSLIVLSTIKLFALFYYTVSHYGFRLPTFCRNRLREQLKYALPFGLSGGLYSMRLQAEQWVVALLFKADVFAVFSVAVSLMPMVEVLRKPVRQVLLPKMSKSHANGDINKVLHLNNQGNLIVSSFLFPILGFLFFFSEQFIEFLFTGSYSAATPLLKIYVIGMLVMGVEVGTMLIVFSQGKFVMKITGSLIILSILASYFGAKLFGLNGAVLGSVTSLYIATIFNLKRTAILMNISVKHLQDWKALFIMLFSAILSSFSALWIINTLFSDFTLVVKLFFGATIICAIYVCLMVIFGYHWLIKVYFNKGQWPSN